MKYVLIITHGRSGSTLLQGILNSIKGWRIYGENFNFAFHLFEAGYCLYRTKTNHGKPKNENPTNPWYGASKINIKDFNNKSALLLRDFVHMNIARDGDKCIGFKEIRYIDILKEDMSGYLLQSYLQFLMQALPSVKLIFLNRKEEDTLKSEWWKKGNSEENMRLLKFFRTFCEKFCSQSPQAFRLDFEALIKKVDTQKSLYEFLEIPFDEKKLKQVLIKPHSHVQSEETLLKNPSYVKSNNLN